MRDRLLGLPAGDFDAVVERRGREIAERLAAALPARLVLLGGKDFAAYRLVGAGFTLDLWDRAGTTLEQDLARRDFTINSLALALADGLLVDPFGGRADLTNRLLRATTSASFTGDPLRVLRLARLLAQLPSFAAEPATLALAARSASGLAAIAAERVREELRLLLEREDAHRGIATLAATGVYPGLWLGTPGDHTDSATGGRAVFRLELLSSCAQAVREAGGKTDLAAARAALLLFGLPTSPEDTLLRLARAGYVSRKQEERLQPLLLWKDLPASELEKRRFLSQTADLWPTAASVLGARQCAAGRSDAWRQWLETLAELLRRDGSQILEPPSLLSGGEVQALLGVPPGPAVGEALRRVRQAQIEGSVRSSADARRLLTTDPG